MERNCTLGRRPSSRLPVDQSRRRWICDPFCAALERVASSAPPTTSLRQRSYHCSPCPSCHDTYVRCSSGRHRAIQCAVSFRYTEFCRDCCIPGASAAGVEVSATQATERVWRLAAGPRSCRRRGSRGARNPRTRPPRACANRRRNPRYPSAWLERRPWRLPRR